MKYLKSLGIIAIVLFSFYYTEKIANFVLMSNKLYQEIDKNKENYEIKSISASIEGKFITPGLEGLSVNVKDSYYNMKDVEVFNSYYLIYESARPVISLEQNKDKIINKGNKEKNSVALVIEYDKNIIEYLKNYNISVLVNLDNYQKESLYEPINNEVKDFKTLDNLINKYNHKNNICLLNSYNEQICRDNQKYLVTPTHTLDDNTYLSLKDKIDSGDIILIKKGTSLKSIETILKSILYKDYQINYLSKHISEERT